MEKKKYLSIKLAGHDYVKAWKNEDKKGNEPDFKGDGVAVWVFSYEPKEEKNQEETI